MKKLRYFGGSWIAISDHVQNNAIAIPSGYSNKYTPRDPEQILSQGSLNSR